MHPTYSHVFNKSTEKGPQKDHNEHLELRQQRQLRLYWLAPESRRIGTICGHYQYLPLSKRIVSSIVCLRSSWGGRFGFTWWCFAWFNCWHFCSLRHVRHRIIIKWWRTFSWKWAFVGDGDQAAQTVSLPSWKGRSIRSFVRLPRVGSKFSKNMYSNLYAPLWWTSTWNAYAGLNIDVHQCNAGHLDCFESY